ncbi:MAG TPA: PQQ-binding-like beta-propeller repeat protein, partial [Bacteroidia bacterium]|nr:PQQ-binding-like beta-propeller repeat protein [Bacteroidia bacterium]
KGTGSIWINKNAADPDNRIVILQGSRKGVDVTMESPQANSYRAVSFFTGKELWRMNVKHTKSYSRDVDASALLIGDTAYIGLENGTFVSFDPGISATKDDSVFRPRVFSQEQLYNDVDAAKHGGNLVTESSPARIGDHVYITAGSGHVYGYDLKTDSIDWDFYIGSDMDGTPVVTSDNCILVAVEKQYINGRGGIFKLDPEKPAADCVDWYFPTGDFSFSSWEGGVIGSPAVNDAYNDGSMEHLAAFTGIDGMLNVVQYDRINHDSLATGPDGKTKYPVPVVRYQKHIGSSISTPIFTKDKLIAAGYSGVNLFSYDAAGIFTHLDFHGGIFEASPVADHGKIYIASRDGFLYCFGDTTHGAGKPDADVVATVKEKPAVKNIKVAAPKNSGNGKYALIAGVFRQKENAQRFRQQWSERGFIAEIIPNGDLYYVSIADASTLEDITKVASDVQLKFSADCWIKDFE